MVDPPQLGIDRLDLLHVGLGPQPVLRVRRYGPRLAFRGFCSSALAAMHPAPVRAPNGGIPAKRATTCFDQASLTRPIRSETRCLAGFEQLLAVN